MQESGRCLVHPIIQCTLQGTSVGNRHPHLNTSPHSMSPHRFIIYWTNRRSHIKETGTEAGLLLIQYCAHPATILIFYLQLRNVCVYYYCMSSFLFPPSNAPFSGCLTPCFSFFLDAFHLGYHLSVFYLCGSFVFRLPPKAIDPSPRIEPFHPLSHSSTLT